MSSQNSISYGTKLLDCVHRSAASQTSLHLQVKGALTKDLNGKFGKFIAENASALEFNQCFLASLAGRKEEEMGKGEVSFGPDARLFDM